MRALFVGVLAASLGGCSCFVSPDIQACTGLNGSGLACFDRHAGVRPGQATGPDAALFEPDSATPEAISKAPARKVKLASADAGDEKPHAGNAERPIAAAAKVELAAWLRRLQASDPVIAKAKTTVAAKLKDPASAVFEEMSRAVRKNTLGQSVDTICGHVKSRKGSGEGTEDRPFLYLVKDDEAFIVDASSTSTAAIAYEALCK